LDTMAYKFTFDLSHFSQSFFREIASFSEKKGIHKRIGKSARYLVRKFSVHKMIGLPISDALMIMEDMIDTYVKNLTHREKFLKTRRRALFLPHCSRKYMDGRCKAKFIPELSYYQCMQCSPDCKINKATQLGKKKGYDVYILPGGSCVKKILMKNKYDGVVGVACCEEIKLAENFLEAVNMPAQAVPLIKNGCSGTKFSMETLENTL
jgi:hypothetical protein